MESRAMMEAARLARLQAKRGRDQVVDLTLSPVQSAKISKTTTSSMSLVYSNGYIALTPTMASPVKISSPIISITDLFQSSNTIKTVILSSFVVDVGWVLDQIGNRQVNVWLVKHWSKDDQEKRGIFQSEYPGCKYIHPPIVTGFGCVHPKIMVIFHERSTTEKYIRVVISSGNLIQVDYEMMENLVFVQDFPLLPKLGSTPLSEPAAAFRDDLQLYLKKLTLPSELIDQLDLYDFSLATVRIVSSIPGQHRDQFGLHSLQRAIMKSNLNLTESEYRSNEMQLECQCSSLGALNRAWLSDFYFAAASPDIALGRKTTDLPPIQVAFPSRETVQGSLAGQLGGGSSIRFSAKHWNASTFPRSMIKDCISVRTGSLMHSKVIICRFPSSKFSVPVGDPIGWVYFGSHNFTRAAWGGFAKSSSLLTINNFEIGVLVPVRKVQINSGYRLVGEPIEPDPDQIWEESLKKCPVPIPFVRPLPNLNGKTPWFPG